MNEKDKIIAAAKEAWRVSHDGKDWPVTSTSELERFWQIAFAAGRQAEREECAEYVERGIGDWQLGKLIAKAIRARRTK